MKVKKESPVQVVDPRKRLHKVTLDQTRFLPIQGGDTESAAYSSASNSDSPAKIKAELKEVKAELKELKDSQKELKDSQEEQREAQHIFQEEVLKRLRPSNFFPPPPEEDSETKEPALKKQRTLNRNSQEE
jgi:Ser-tRNA(Ala) deacylase AlaX